MVKANDTKKLFVIFLFVFFLIPSKNVLAVPPPDFLIQIASQIGQLFAIGLAFFTVVFTTIYQFFKNYFIKYKKTSIIIGILLIITLAGVSAYFIDKEYRQYKANKEYEKWKKEVEAQKKLAISPKSVESQYEIILEKINEIKEQGRIIENSWTQNKNSALMATNKELDDYIKSGSDEYLILDAREDLEREMGRVPNSVHIRFADLEVGRWQELPKDKFVYVFCYGGERGKDVAMYLRKQKIVAKYLEQGLKTWIPYGGAWEGEISFSKRFPDKRYGDVISTADVKDYVKKGVRLVDCRSEEKFRNSKIKNSIYISLMNTPSDKVDEMFSKMKGDETVIIICDNVVNCFDAKLTALELEKRGVTFLGRYNKPWEY